MVHTTPQTPERAEAIATLRAATGISTDEEAIRLLTASSWDLDRAATLFLDSPSSSTAPAPPPTPRPTPVRHLTTPTPQIRFPRWLAAVFSPLQFVWSFISTITQTLLNALGGPARAIDNSPGENPTARFINFFNQRYGTTHPPFFDGGYFAALSAAQADIKFLLVYLHSESHRLTHAFARDVLASPPFLQASSPFVVWASSVTQREGAAAHYALRAPALPFLAVVAAPSARISPDADLAGANFGTVLAVRAGPPALVGGGEGAARWLQRVMERHGGLLDDVRRAREERESARLLREQQDAEYARALEEDRERERKLEEERRKVEVEENRIKQLEIRRERKRENLGVEPEKGAGVASVALRLPDGSKVGRRFKLEDKLEAVFDWAEVNRVDIEVACLVCTYPRRRFRYPEDAGISVKEAGLFPSVMLLLEERADE
eukprot:GFKZ01005795.1.p1 GENE.GFKZ01005795.1~~GFKZ01005795.1.p1  ORF type:complete len:460 (+),score=77.16 GFKZ01005795.1:76-1380(+)